MENRKSSAEVVAESLREKLQSRAPGFVDRLPAVRDLASEFQVSPATVLVSLSSLCRQGVIEHPQGKRGYFVAGSAARRALQSRPAHRTRGEKLADLLGSQILRGQLLPDTVLPNIRASQRVYRAGHAAVVEAMAELCKRGLITDQGGRFAVAGPASYRSGGSSFYVLGSPCLVESFKGHVLSLITTIQHEIQTRGWGHLRFMLSSKPLEASAPPSHQCAGFLYFGPSTSQQAVEWRTFFQKRPRIPLVRIVLSETPKPFDNPGVRQFFALSPDNVQAGRDMARHLHKLGHRRIALISHVPLNAAAFHWAGLRAKGISELFGDDVRGETCCRIFSRCEPVAHKTRETLRSTETIMAPFIRRKDLPERYAMARRDALHDVLFLADTAQAMRPLFKEAHLDTSITAWVCIEDSMAALAATYLKSAGVSIPRDISVVGFDNSPSAYQMGITTYDFGLVAMGHAAIQCFARPSSVPVNQFGELRISGTVVELDSSAPPRSSKGRTRPKT